jgi:methionine synthase II (cobalamin-independent)
MNIILPGQYPRSESLISATRNFDRNRIDLNELEKARKEDVASFKSLQKGFPFYSTGLFQWQDLLRPFGEVLKPSSTVEMVRFYETNSFWRLLECDTEPTLEESQLDHWIEKYFFANKTFLREEPLIFTLPFLFLFQQYSQGISLATISHILKTVALKLAKNPNKMICFYEPSFGWKNIDASEKRAAITFLESIIKETSTPVFIYSSFFSIHKDRDFLFSLPVQGIGIDFFANSFRECVHTFPKDKALMAGILNTESTLIEEENKLKTVIHELYQHISAQQIYFTFSGNAELVPRTVMDSKVNILKKALL